MMLRRGDLIFEQKQVPNRASTEARTEFEVGVVTEQLEDVLRRFQQALAGSGDAEAARDMSELLTAAAAAAELLAALERGDFTAAEFHTEILERQVADLRPLKFLIE